MRPVKIRICQTAFVAALAAGLLAGCGEEKTIDYSIEGTAKEEQQQEGGSSRLEQFADAGVWKEEWHLKYKNADGQMEDAGLQIRVDAPVTVPKTAQMSVVEAQEPEFDAAYKEKIASRLFESGEIYYADYSHLPKKDLEEILAGNMAWDTVYNMAVLNSPLSVEQLNAESRELQAALDNIENAGDSYVAVEDYMGNQYIGLYEGRLYNLSFAEAEGFNDFCRRKRITWAVRNLREVCPEKMKEQEQLTVTPWTRGSWVENQCQISEEEARKEAEQFVDRLGLDYSVYSDTTPLMWGEPLNRAEVAGGTQSDDLYVDGYVFAFDLGVDGISFVGYGMEEDYKDFSSNRDKADEKQYSMDSRLQVYVTDKGVIKVEADNPIEITGVKESVGLLSLDAVKGIMKEKTAEQDDSIHLFPLDQSGFNEMELIYFRVRDRENPGKYSYVPTWRLAVVTRDGLMNRLGIRNPVLVNAIDGSLIDFYDET